DLGKQATTETRCLEDIQRRRGDGQVGQTSVGHQQRPVHARLGTGLGQLSQAPRAEPDGGRVAPVSGQHHVVTFFIMLLFSLNSKTSAWSGCGSRSPTGRRRAPCPCSRSSTG